MSRPAPSPTDRPDPPEYVRFPFAARTLEGRVIDAELQARFNDPFRTRLTVDVDGERYPVLRRNATAIPIPAEE